MLARKMVFVVGAGASAEVRLPVGDLLKRMIMDALDFRIKNLQLEPNNGDPRIYEILRQRSPNYDVGSYWHVCQLLRAGLPLSSSVDDFVHLHQDNKKVAECGKLAIVSSILKTEQISSLWYSKKDHSTINFSGVETTWYMAFYRLISSGLIKKNLEKLFQDVTIICFNYDRCIEQFLMHAIDQHCNVGMEEAQRLVGTLKIFRPYGSVGPLFGPAQHVVEYGSTDLPSFDKVMTDLRTYTEQVEDKATLDAMRKAVDEASVVVFLGNAYHKNNMDLLKPEGSNTVSLKEVFATCRGISDGDRPAVIARIEEAVGGVNGGVRFADTCVDLFSRYRLSMNP